MPISSRTSRTPLSLSALLLAAMVLVRLYRYPAFFYPREPTMFDRLPAWVHRALLSPVNTLVNNPIALAVVSFATGLLGLYWLIDYLSGCRDSGVPQALKTSILLALITITVVVPVSWKMLCRYQTAPYKYAHDGGVIQTEEAMKMVLTGRNPYRETYHDTPMRRYARNDMDPPLYHWPYLPFYLVVGIPIRQFFLRFTGWFDMRYVYLLFYAMSLVYVYRLIPKGDARLQGLILFGLNPFLIPFLEEGRNDIIPLALMVAAVHYLGEKRLMFSAVVLGLACAAKQFAWILAPFMFIGYFSSRHMSFRKKITVAVAFLLPVVVIVGPFMVWDFPAFWDDVVAFNAGNTEINYYIGGTPGYGAANFLLTWGKVHSRTEYYPFWIWQLVAGAPVLLLALAGYRRTLSIRYLFAGFAISLFFLIYFSRLTHDNYLGFIFGLLVLSVYAGNSSLAEEENREPGE